jgi:hypothetical protein
LTRSFVAALVLVAALLSAGCAPAGEEAAVRAATNRFFAALASGDGAGACAQLSAETRSKLESQEGRPCRAAIGDLGLKAAAVTRVHVHIVDALVELAGGRAAFLGHEQDGWRISAVGCSSAGKSADRPYDCDVED